MDAEPMTFERAEKILGEAFAEPPGDMTPARRAEFGRAMAFATVGIASSLRDIASALHSLDTKL